MELMMVMVMVTSKTRQKTVTKPASSPREKVDNTPLQTGKQISYHGWIRSMSRYHGVDLKYKNK